MSGKHLAALTAAVACVVAVITTYIDYDKWFVIPRARSTIASQMKDPSSTQFRNDHMTTAGWLCGELNAKNGYGAYPGFRRFMSSTDEQWLEGAGRFGTKPQSVLESSAVASDFLDEKIAQDKARVAYKAEHPEDRQAIYHFALLWSLFEAKALNTHATANAILALVQERGTQGRVDPTAFAPSLRHFRDRYVQDGEFTAHFDGLHLRKNDNAALVKLVLQDKDDTSVDAVAALLIIVYRLRNNLFHGIKWAYGLQNQRANFSAANDALMYAFVQLVDQ